MVNTNKSEIILISESNAEINDKKKMDLRNKEFPNYKFEDKLVTGNEKARSTIMIHNSIDHIRFKKFEDPLNSTTCIKIKDGSNKWVYIMSVYRQWKLKGDFNAFNSEGIK